MLKRRNFLIAATILFFSGTAFAQESTMTAKNLLQVCTTPDMHWVDFCNGFFQAVHDQQTSLGKLCAPSGTTRTNLVEIYEQKAADIINKYPDEGEKTAVDIAAKILVETFPCIK